MTEMQKQFEEWAVSQKWCVDKTGDVYNNTYVGCSWQAWQASRAAVVVKLPSVYVIQGHRYVDESSVLDMLEEIGAKHE